MRITNRNGKMDAGGRHNDRQFDLESAPHIDKGKVKDNKYWVYNGEYNQPLRDTEMEFYEAYFSEHIKAQNARNESYGKANRNKTIEDYFSSYRTRLEDKILQIGNKDDHIDADTLWECAKEYAERFNDLFGDHCKIVDMALHVDEATPHVHIRRAWIAQDKDGHDCINRNMALDQLGFVRPDTNSPQGRYNNPTMVFTKTDAALFEEICYNRGLDIDKDNPINREHLSVIDYKKTKIIEEIEELERKRDTINEEIEEAAAEEIVKEMEDIFKDAPSLFDHFEHDLMHIEEKKAKEKLRLLMKIYTQAMRQAKRSLQIVADAKSFIKEEGLEKKFDSYMTEKMDRDER